MDSNKIGACTRAKCKNSSLHYDRQLYISLYFNFQVTINIMVEIF